MIKVSFTKVPNIYQVLQLATIPLKQNFGKSFASNTKRKKKKFEVLE
jgi:hypothetical protein